MQNNVVIIGASHAAAEAIGSLKKAGWQGKITLIGDEPELPYQRPPLSKGYYNGDIALEKLAIRRAEYYDKAEVDLYLGKRAESLNRERKEVVLDDGTIISYTKVILATGTRARKLSVPGIDIPEVNYLRTLADVDTIKEQLSTSAELLIVGAGYIGLEIAASAIKQGVKVTVLETEKRVLARVTSPEISEFYQQVHHAEGVDIRLQAHLESISGEINSRDALLATGVKIPFDCAIVGIGVIPNSELAEQAGLSCDNGIIVDSVMRTDDPDIYAVGDCSNHPNPMYQRRLRLESVPNAVGQAKTAALSICGKDEAYNQLPWFWSDQYDLKLQTAGLLEGYDQVIVKGNMKERKFSVSYFKQGKLIALDAINSPAEFMKAKKQISLELM